MGDRMGERFVENFYSMGFIKTKTDKDIGEW